jgi:hypothetical protein
MDPNYVKRIVALDKVIRFGYRDSRLTQVESSIHFDRKLENLNCKIACKISNYVGKILINI